MVERAAPSHRARHTIEQHAAVVGSGLVDNIPFTAARSPVSMIMATAYIAVRYL
jgi:hypothetical protein